ncbi:hypothetical protein SAMD00019534_068830 [Acytostelium subglobosum LB1]|uniref:hypothetical protein n=1 Tax=Acytostelium subglobosum LB1 TaxID=1410327 RepID=UPI000644F6B8|nr:hypothetical protein SAMD00019534_068830 [Acytostelium subglobosum LB1]GAM23708.1 hypothetical protein SAMD00019534_068830 [Acytostelium subglobosum LB1]|eukprot:XP_012753449.1 hypothetical protein SAMD00019534_068830 [Acytostelium subglobosum LB1]
MSTPIYAWSLIYLRPGAMGVDLFFLVSGFIMVYTTRSSDGSLKYVATFLIKRFARIWPVFAIIFAIQMIFTVTFLRESSFLVTPLKANEVFKTLFFYPVNPKDAPYFGQTFGLAWTLNFEIYFYLIFGLSMLARGQRYTALMFWIVITLVLFPIIRTGNWSLLPNYTDDMWFGYMNLMCNPIIWDFAVGMFGGFLYMSTSIKNKWFSAMLILCNIVYLICIHLIFLVSSYGLETSLSHGIFSISWPLIL